jgi:hypothetical protein
MLDAWFHIETRMAMRKQHRFPLIERLTYHSNRNCRRSSRRSLLGRSNAGSSRNPTITPISKWNLIGCYFQVNPRIEISL